MLRFLLTILVAVSASDMDRIIGGNFASPNQFPYQVSVQIKRGHRCGGSFISETYIITAAHCVDGKNEVDILAGSNNLRSGFTRLEISKYTIHPQYKPPNQDYDLALIELRTPVQFGEQMKAIEMSTDSNYPADTMSTVSGFGAINELLHMTSILKYANVEIWSRDSCKNLPGITDRMICAGHPSGQEGTCPGDSGGPLAVNNKLLGVLSWGFGCGKPDKPQVFTSVGALRPWISQVSGI